MIPGAQSPIASSANSAHAAQRSPDVYMWKWLEVFMLALLFLLMLVIGKRRLWKFGLQA